MPTTDLPLGELRSHVSASVEPADFDEINLKSWNTRER